jgi:hypothetical protein
MGERALHPMTVPQQVGVPMRRPMTLVRQRFSPLPAPTTLGLYR